MNSTGLMNREIGGYIELEHFRGKMLHEKAVRVNNARNALCLLIRKRGIKRMLMPYFICDSVIDGCLSEGVELEFYEVGMDFKPMEIHCDVNQWLYLVNYYGQLEEEFIRDIKNRYDRVILDDVQAYYHETDESIDTVYSCRKFFGLPDGGLLMAKGVDADDYPQDVSYDRMTFLLGRYEVDANSFYDQYVANNNLMGTEPIKCMSRLTENLLRAVDYDSVAQTRECNFNALHSRLSRLNVLSPHCPIGPFAYPLYIKDAAALRKKLIAHKVYVPLLWPNVVAENQTRDISCRLAENILPLPCDQRYDENDMNYMADLIEELLA